MIAAGSGLFAGSMFTWRAGEWFPFLLWVAGAVAASKMKVRLPGITGTMSVTFLFVLVGVIELDLPRTLVIACAGTLAQCLWQTSVRPALLQVLFNAGSITLSSGAAYLAFHTVPANTSYEVLAVMAAALAYFAFNTVGVSAVIALTESKSLTHVWRQSFLWTAPHYLVGGALAALVHALNRSLGWEITVLFFPVVYLVYRTYDVYVGRLAEEQQHTLEVAELHWRTIEALALAIEAKDGDTHGHLQRVQFYAIHVGRELGLAEPEMQALRAAALLHDIGKLAVPEYIISKPGKLTREEFEKMKTHSVVGAEILERVRFPYPVVPIVRAHHEKWNGMGYPDGLRGEQIPMGARILAALDFLDALISDRPYRRAFPIEKVVAMLVEESGKSYDPQVVSVIERRYREMERQMRASTCGQAALTRDPVVERGAAPDAGLDPTANAPSAKTDPGALAAARHDLKNLLAATADPRGSFSLEETLSLAAVRLRRIVPADGIAIYVLRNGFLAPVWADPRSLAAVTVPEGKGVSGWVAENRRPIVNGNAAMDLNQENGAPALDLRSALAVSLEGPAGLVAVLTLYRKAPDGFSHDDLRLIEAVRPSAAILVERELEREQSRRKAVHQAEADWGAVVEALDRQIEGLEPGHGSIGLFLAAASAVNADAWKALAAALEASCREGDNVIPLPGAQYAVILPGLTRERLEARAEQLAAAGSAAARQPGIVFAIASFPEDGARGLDLVARAAAQLDDTRQAVPGRCAPAPLERLRSGTILVQ